MTPILRDILYMIADAEIGLELPRATRYRGSKEFESGMRRRSPAPPTYYMYLSSTRRRYLEDHGYIAGVTDDHGSHIYRATPKGYAALEPKKKATPKRDL